MLGAQFAPADVLLRIDRIVDFFALEPEFEPLEIAVVKMVEMDWMSFDMTLVFEHNQLRRFVILLQRRYARQSPKQLMLGCLNEKRRVDPCDIARNRNMVIVEIQLRPRKPIT